MEIFPVGEWEKLGKRYRYFYLAKIEAFVHFLRMFLLFRNRFRNWIALMNQDTNPVRSASKDGKKPNKKYFA